MNLLSDAIAYAESGSPIFPLHNIVNSACSCKLGSACHSPGKHPLTKNGFKDASTDINQIKRWWEKNPEANIGLWCKGLIVVDVDPRNGGDISLEELFSTVADVHGFETLTAITGGGGRHYIFTAPDDASYDCKPVPGIEIKSSGGLIVIAPSMHISGQRYEWEDPTISIAPCPQWILKLIAAPSKPSERPLFTGKPLDLEKFIAKHHIQVKAPKASKCNFGGYQWDIDGGCPFQPAYTGGSPAIGVTASGATWFGCFCGDHPTKTWKDFKSLYEPAKAHNNTSGPSIAVAPPPPDHHHDDSTNISADWHQLLHLDTAKKQHPRPVLINVDIALRYSPEWNGVLAFDEFKQKIVITGTPPIIGGDNRPWTDEDDTRATIWMHCNGIYVGVETVGAAVYAIARENKIHPVKDYLTSLKWDGTPRLESWLARYMGATAENEKQKTYISNVGSMWMISAVARILSPGCKVDHMLVLEGPQGTKKSTALSILAGAEYFCDSMPDISSKDAAMQTAGSWIIEWSELDAMRRAETTAIKAFVTRQTEKIRPPYGRATIEFPRQCVFAGTTNKDDYLCDETGNRRFWPVKCHNVDTDSLRRDRDQLWAEAVFLYSEGNIWWFATAQEASQGVLEQKDRVEIDPWTEKISDYTSRNLLQANFSCEEILDSALKVDTSRQTIIEKRRVGRIMREIGFTYKTTRDDPSATSKKFCRKNTE